MFRYVISRILPSTRLKTLLWRRWYRYFDNKVREQPLRFLNFGLALPSAEQLTLSAEDEAERYSIQLYHRTLSAADLRGARVLEVSCGRGGGVDYMVRCLSAGRVVGLDQTESALAHCRQLFDSTAIQFVCGDAMALPFAAESFDAVVNVEASHCYPRAPGFFAEVRRVLRPGGHFLYADFRGARSYDGWRKDLDGCGLTKVAEEEITAKVAEGLEFEHQRRTDLIRNVAPRVLRRAFSQFAGTKDSVMYRGFKKGRVRYFRFAYRK
jgi:SAM-dependent methyltransferase